MLNRRSFFGAITSLAGALGLAKVAQAEPQKSVMIHGIRCRKLTEAELEVVKKAARELAESLKAGGVVALPSGYGVSSIRAAYDPWKAAQDLTKR